jgi:uncharacterized protein
MATGISDTLKTFVEETVKLIVDKPSEVMVTSVVSTKSIIIQVKTEKSDCGKVIGKKGKTIDSLKILALAIKNTTFPQDSRKVIIEILEDEGSGYSRRNTSDN